MPFPCVLNDFDSDSETVVLDFIQHAENTSHQHGRVHLFHTLIGLKPAASLRVTSDSPVSVPRLIEHLPLPATVEAYDDPSGDTGDSWLHIAHSEEILQRVSALNRGATELGQYYGYPDNAIREYEADFPKQTDHHRKNGFKAVASRHLRSDDIAYNNLAPFTTRYTGTGIATKHYNATRVAEITRTAITNHPRYSSIEQYINRENRHEKELAETFRWHIYPVANLYFTLRLLGGILLYRYYILTTDDYRYPSDSFTGTPIPSDSESLSSDLEQPNNHKN
jgi:hypothetical protein